MAVNYVQSVSRFDIALRFSFLSLLLTFGFAAALAQTPTPTPQQQAVEEEGKVSINKLASMFNVGRFVIRRVLRQAEADGAVIIRPIGLNVRYERV